MQACDRLAVAPGSAGILARIASLPCGEKSGEKSEEVISRPYVIRRSLFFVAPATPAGTLSRRKPGETVKALPGRPGRPGCGLPGAPKLPRMRGRCGRTSFGPGAGTVRLGRKSCVGRAVLFAVGAQGSHNQKPPPGPPHPPPSHGFPAHDCRDYPVLCALSRHCPAYFFSLSKCHTHRQPFSVRLTTSAVSRRSLLRLSECCGRCDPAVTRHVSGLPGRRSAAVSWTRLQWHFGARRSPFP